MSEPQINEMHGSYNIGDRTEPVEYIVCHYVGNGDSHDGSARDNCEYFGGGYRGASAHYFVDDGGIWEYADPDGHYTLHCGDGHGAYGITNRNSVGIEVCIDGDAPYTDAEIGHMSRLVPWLMGRYGLDASRVVRHYDASRKDCPLYYTPYGSGGDGAWEALRERITSGTNENGKEDDLKQISIPAGTYDVYRLYDGTRHMWTSSEGERDGLVSIGWSDEGVAWRGADTGEVVYRMYNPNDGLHHFTASYDEAKSLSDAGWEYEGANFASARDGSPVHRMYNPNTGEHFFTASQNERECLMSGGWGYEGVAFNAE